MATAAPASIAQRLRFWERNWVQEKARYKAKDVVLIELDPNLPTQARSHLEIAISFSSSGLAPAIIESTGENKKFIERVVDSGAKYFISAGKKLSISQRRVLQFLGIPYLELSANQIPAYDLPKDGFEARGAMLQKFERRHVIYLHKPRKTQLALVLRTFMEVKRRYPDLLLALTGVSEKLMSAIESDIKVAHINDRKSKILLSDVVYEDTKMRQNDWLACANLELIMADGDDIDDKIRTAVERGVAVVVFGDTVSGSKLYNELEAKGAIWGVRKAINLVPVLSQALEPEKAALTTLQSSTLIAGGSTKFIEDIDRLLVS